MTKSRGYGDIHQNIQMLQNMGPLLLDRKSVKILGLNKAIHIINICTHNIWYLQPNIPNTKVISALKPHKLSQSL